MEQGGASSPSELAEPWQERQSLRSSKKLAHKAALRPHGRLRFVMLPGSPPFTHSDRHRLAFSSDLHPYHMTMATTAASCSTAALSGQRRAFRASRTARRSLRVNANICESSNTHSGTCVNLVAKPSTVPTSFSLVPQPPKFHPSSAVWR